MLGENLATVTEQIADTHAPAPGKAKPRILFLIDEIGAITDGGTERQIFQLVQLARRLGYQPRLAVLRGTEWLREEDAGCPVYSARADSLFRISGWLGFAKLVRWMRKEQIALVQTFFAESNIFGPWLARRAGVPVVISSRRNLNQWQDRPDWIRSAMLQLQRWANSSTDCIVGNSQMVVDEMSRIEHVSRNKMRVAYNGIDLNLFAGLDRKRAGARRMLGIADDEILVGNISCMRPVKGLRQFVDAAHLVLAKDPQFRFLIVGDGSERDAIVERIHRYGIEDRIHLAGAQTDVLPYLAAMDIGVLSSLAEGFSNSLLEYMAAALPAIATEVGGNREAVQDTGILVPPDKPSALADAILELRSAATRHRLGDAARRRAELFSLARAEQCMENLYRELLESKQKFQPKN